MEKNPKYKATGSKYGVAVVRGHGKTSGAFGFA
jgi:hypothetical protein